ncbi:cytochrome c5 family protein [bacterium]|jgi:cytochrome c5|nr:cytochrome c5 family protein [bacterium]NBX72426.1 cytochrome c5 family protein [bacterium]
MNVFKGILFTFMAVVSAYQKQDDLSYPETIKRLAPPATINIGGTVPEKEIAETFAPGQKVYQKYCSVCHGYGVAGAPKMGDKESWTERYKKGWQTLMNHALNGYKGMPARGHCVKCSDKEIREAIAYIFTQSNVEQNE